MRIRHIAFSALALAAACAVGVEEPYFPDGGKSGRAGGGTGGSGGGAGSRGGTTSGSTGAGATGGRSGSGGSGGSGGSSGRGGGSGGSSGRGGTGGTGPGGAGGTGGRAGGAADGGTIGCPGVADWTMGNTYAQGDNVRAVCSVSGTGASQCTVGKTYVYSCSDPGLGLCGVFAPGAANWWLFWAIGMQCN